MDENTTRTRHGRWRPFHLAWALIALVVLSACASTLVRSEAEAVGSIRLDAAAELDFAEPLPATKAFADDGVVSSVEARSPDRAHGQPGAGGR